jgi:hypothetical protein
VLSRPQTKRRGKRRRRRIQAHVYGVFSRGTATVSALRGVLIEPNRVNVPISHRSVQGAKRGPDRAYIKSAACFLRHNQVAPPAVMTFAALPRNQTPGLELASPLRFCL